MGYTQAVTSPARTYYLNEAKTAGADLIYILEITQSRNINTGEAACLKDSGSGGNGVFPSVDFYIYHIHVLSFPFLLLGNRTELTFFDAAPHFTHFFVSMT